MSVHAWVHTVAARATGWLGEPAVMRSGVADVAVVMPSVFTGSSAGSADSESTVSSDTRRRALEDVGVTTISPTVIGCGCPDSENAAASHFSKVSDATTSAYACPGSAARAASDSTMRISLSSVGAACGVSGDGVAVPWQISERLCRR